MVETKPIESIPVVENLSNSVVKVSEPVAIETPTVPKIPVSNSTEVKVSALSLASIRAKRELQETSKLLTKEETHLPAEDFTETDMLLQWNKYAQRLGDKGHKIMESLLLINDPVLKGTAITLELPNEGSKIDFETEKHGLLGHLRSHLHNHKITIEVIVNEAVETKQAFTTQEKYNRLCEKNPNLEILRKTFDLDI
ncbi:DNA polymerase III subunit gamma/tau [Flavobacterium sp. GT3R68]|uniref:DNA polymerase III subunit gamma/tau n=1 Tax=Flavobacterium sp. GT3R68 TaxID=2594437 RepID=UPI0021065AD9|nr:DNA polymerase III subunit gamma/tau [Flavobacterium sp. GT3R68]